MISINVLLIAVVDSLTMTKSEEVGLCSIAAFLRMRGHHVDIISIFEEEIDYGRLKEMAPDLIGFPVYSLSEACVARVAVRMKEDMPESEFWLVMWFLHMTGFICWNDILSSIMLLLVKVS